MYYDSEPLSVPACDQQRIYDSWRLRMMLDGSWRPLLAAHGEVQLGSARASLVGEWDTSANLFSSVIDQTSTMYDTPPEIRGDAVLRASFESGGWWGMARQHQRYVRGLHESAVFVGWDSERVHPTYELVTPDLLTVETAAGNAARPETVWRARRRKLAGREFWVWDRWSVAGGVGSLTVWDSGRQRNITSAFFDPAAWSGAAYPYRGADGRPLIPAVLYHSAGTGNGVWHTHQHQEIVFGTLQVGVLWTSFVHGFLRASWDQRWIANGRVRGGAVEQAGDRPIRVIIPDPTAVLEIDGQGATAGAWGSPIDIDAAEGVVRRYENRLAVHAGLSPADVVIESLNPASGASIVVSQSGKRTIALRDLVHFRSGDVQLAEVTAAVNRGWGVACSAEGFSARYRGVELTIGERETVSRWLPIEMDRGLLDRVTAYQELHPGTSAADAQADLEAMDDRKRMAEARAKVLAELAGGAVQDTALNGAQVQSLQLIVQAVAQTQLPRDSAVNMIQRAFSVDEATADRLVGSAGRGFKPAVPAAA